MHAVAPPPAWMRTCPETQRGVGDSFANSDRNDRNAGVDKYPIRNACPPSARRRDRAHPAAEVSAAGLHPSLVRAKDT